MPIYEYICDAPRCGHTFDVLQKMSDSPIRVCPHCKKRQVRKLVSASSFILKGSGWYQNDIARKEKTEKAAHADKLKQGKEPAAPTAATAAKDDATPAKAAPKEASEPKGKSPSREKSSDAASKVAASGV